MGVDDEDGDEEGGTAEKVRAVTVAAKAGFVAINRDSEWAGNVTRAAGTFWRRSATLTTGSHTTMQLLDATAPVDVFVIAGSHATVDMWLASNASADLAGSLLAQRHQTTRFNYTVSVPLPPLSEERANAARSETFFMVVLFRHHGPSVTATMTKKTTTIRVGFSSHRHVIQLDWLAPCRLPCTLQLPFTSSAATPFAVVQGGDGCLDTACSVTATAPPRRAAWWVAIFLPVVCASLLLTLCLVLGQKEIARRSMLRGSPLHRFSQLPQDEDEESDRITGDPMGQQMEPLTLDAEQTVPPSPPATDAITNPADK